MERVFVYDEEDEEEEVPKPYFKYTKGSSFSINEVKEMTPLISYEYISLNQSDFCFDYPELSNFDYTQYFKILRDISKKQIIELLDKPDHQLHFHMINLHVKKELQEKVRNILDLQRKKDELPLVCQFALYTNETIEGQKTKAPRVIAMVYKGTFYILFVDVYHQTYMKPRVAETN